MNSADTAYEANAATATVLVVPEWDDSLKDVERTLHELRIAKANVVGTIFFASQSLACDLYVEMRHCPHSLIA